RMDWVDAIYINQENLAERTTQVAKMKCLYRKCTRVAVYLGEDLITCSTRFPKSAPLDSLYQKKCIFPKNHPLREFPFRLTKLLSRRYFSRFWIIQELAVCQR
ncbi:hypothetical protein BCR34DRAFT_464749, partial [Clohesyomyces aquaticus]